MVWSWKELENRGDKVVDKDEEEAEKEERQNDLNRSRLITHFGSKLNVPV